LLRDVPGGFLMLQGLVARLLILGFKALLRLYEGAIKALFRFYSGSIQAISRLY
jgi:hypothetical protein